MQTPAHRPARPESPSSRKAKLGFRPPISPNPMILAHYREHNGNSLPKRGLGVTAAAVIGRFGESFLLVSLIN